MIRALPLMVCGGAISLAATYMQVGFLRGLVFGVTIGLAYGWGRFVEANR